MKTENSILIPNGKSSMNISGTKQLNIPHTRKEKQNKQKLN